MSIDLSLMRTLGEQGQRSDDAVFLQGTVDGRAVQRPALLTHEKTPCRSASSWRVARLRTKLVTFPIEFKFRVGGCHRFGSCAFGGIEIESIFCSFDRPGFSAQRDAVNSRSPGGVPEAKRGAAFCAASTRAVGQGLTGGAEPSAIVAGRKDKRDRNRIAERLSGAMYRWLSCFQHRCGIL